MAPSAMTYRWTSRSPKPQPVPYWLDDPGRPARPSPRSPATSLRPARRRRRLQRTVDRADRQGARPASATWSCIEGHEVGWAASGRNGGFCAASLTHGLANGLARWPDEIAKLEELGDRNLDAIEAAVARYSLDCDFERTGEIDVATEPHQVGRAARVAPRKPREHGLDRHRIPRPRRGARRGRLADLPRRTVGPRAASPCSTPPSSPGASSGPASAWACGSTSTPRAIALTGERRRHGRPHPVRPGPRPPGRARHQRLPVAGQAGAPVHRPGLRLRADDRAAHRRPARLHRLEEPPGPRRQRQPVPLLPALRRQPHPVGRLRRDLPATAAGCAPSTTSARRRTLKLAGHFFTCFPQLEGVRFTHAWGGAIDTCSRFSAFFGTAHGGRVAYAAGLHRPRRRRDPLRRGRDARPAGRGAHRAHRSWRWSAASRCRSRPSRSPGPGIALTKWSLARADAHGGRRNLWLKAMDKAGAGLRQLSRAGCPARSLWWCGGGAVRRRIGCPWARRPIAMLAAS